jgi:hypothetical protein
MEPDAMTLSIENQSQSIIADICIDQNAERYECTLSACPSPACGCQVIYLDMTRIVARGDDTQTPCRHVEIDLLDKSLGFNNKKDLSQEKLQFAELFLSSLNEDDYDLLFKKHFEIKNRLTEDAKPDSIDALFDYQEIERDGMKSGYNEVLPYADRLYVTLEDKKYIVDDQYCLQPNCSCTDATLCVLTSDETAKRLEVICWVDVNYKKKVWELVEDGPLKISLDTLRSAIEKEIPHFYDTLHKRHVRLKSIYACCKKKHYAAKQPLVLPKVGRNDPCPCGSGKKFKKCCSEK